MKEATMHISEVIQFIEKFLFKEHLLKKDLVTELTQGIEAFPQPAYKRDIQLMVEIEEHQYTAYVLVNMLSELKEMTIQEIKKELEKNTTVNCTDQKRFKKLELK